MTNCHNRVNFSKRLTYLMLTLLASFTESRYANLSQAWATEKKTDLGILTYQRAGQLKK